jgi:hypothetical protein
MYEILAKSKCHGCGPFLLACIALSSFLVIEPVVAHEKRDSLRIDVPRRPRLANTTYPVLYTCSKLADCQHQATHFCSGFNYPNGKILFRDLPTTKRPFPIYSVICFD